eukprot:11680214-Karenia_brevis.AAC.1
MVCLGVITSGSPNDIIIGNVTLPDDAAGVPNGGGGGGTSSSVFCLFGEGASSIGRCVSFTTSSFGGLISVEVNFTSPAPEL